MAERKIARLQFSQVAQHFRLGVVRVEDRMRQEFRLTIRDGGSLLSASSAKRDAEMIRRCSADHLPVVVSSSEMPIALGPSLRRFIPLWPPRLRIAAAGLVFEIDMKRVEEIFVHDLQAALRSECAKSTR